MDSRTPHLREFAINADIVLTDLIRDAASAMPVEPLVIHDIIKLAGKTLQPRNLAEEQVILDVFWDYFRGDRPWLCLGWDIDHTREPFFHVIRGRER